MESVVADTCALVSLAIPKADTTYDTAVDPDPLQYLLTGCDVTVPTQVEAELREMAGYDDVHAAAATNVRAASKHYAVVDPLDHEDAPEALPTYGLDEGETAAIVLANGLGVDGLLTDEFNQLARIHALVEGARLVPTPRLLRDYARNGHLTDAQARRLVETIAPHRSWGENSYVQAVLETL
jgi:predicted nucleic acid-binding protein